MKAVEVIALNTLALYGGPYLQKVLAFAGALCGTPISLIYPALFHLKLRAVSPGARALDVGLVAIGFSAMAFVLFQALS